MLSHFVKSSLKIAAPLTLLLLLGVSPSVGQQQVNLAAGSKGGSTTAKASRCGVIGGGWPESTRPQAARR